MTVEILKERIDRIRQELAEASEGRYSPPRLIAVTKTHPAEAVLPLLSLGATEIGENRVQELREKLPALGGSFQIHLIGRLQRNKVRRVIRDVCMIQSLDSLSLAEEIHRQAMTAERRMPVLVEISPAGEAQKGGVPPEAAETLIRQAARLEGLRIQGLMAVMPLTEDEAWLDRLFGETRQLFDRLRETAIPGVEMKELSMGMSGDYRLAARHGATMVRLGSAIFGPRGDTGREAHA